MINKKFLQVLRKEYQESDSARRQIISLANVVLHDSKRLIFALHRGDISGAKVKFLEVEEILKKLDKKFGNSRVNDEGAYKACVEEYVEAKLLYFVLAGEKIDKIKGLSLNYDSYLGGICDLAGELVRYATNEAAAGRFKKVEEIKQTVNEIMSELVDFDMTGYLRTKYDQARGHLRKLEQMAYEVNLRK